MLGEAQTRMGRARDAARAACVWPAMAIAAGVAIPSAHPEALASVAVLGTVAVISRRPWAVAAPLGAAAFFDLGIVPWAVAATAVSWSLAPSFPPPRLGSEPQRQLMRSRRRDEPASVVVVQAVGPAGPAEVWPSLRATDGFDVVKGCDGIELRGVLEDQGLDRAAFEQRLLGLLGAQARIGWASFPADGVTLETLVDAARARLTPSEAITYPATAGPALPARVTAIAEES